MVTLEALQQLQATLAAQQPTKDPAEATNELAERLLTDPKAVIREELNEWGRETIGPMAVRDYEVQRDERIETRASEIDEDWGDGFFDKEIRPRLTGDQGTLAAWPINQQMDPRVIDSAINGILGNDFRDPEKRAEMQEALTKTARAKAEREVQTPPNMMGPGRVRPAPSNVLTPALKDALEGFQRAGVQITEKQIKDSLTRGRTLSDWQKEATQ
jgi:hypothetical protein